MLFNNFLSSSKKEALDRGLQKTRASFFDRLGKAFAGKSKIDDDTLDELEALLVASDVGVQMTIKIIDRVQQRVAKDKYLNAGELDCMLREEITSLFIEKNSHAAVNKNHFQYSSAKPYVIMMVGVNGVGKTTTAGKLAAQFAKNNAQVILGAADTFRAAAVDQLQLWGGRVGAWVVTKPPATPPSAVAYESVKQGVEKNADVVIIDTAGRLHTKVHLMNELAKVRRVTQKIIPESPHEVLLVLDGSAGQNAIMQAREFIKATAVTGIVVTKLDGTAKGGVVIGISDEFKIPIRYIGVGERVDDLQVFDKKSFINSLFSKH